MNATTPTVLITGAARRIGRTVALTAARAGWNVALHYHRSTQEAAALAREIEAMGQRAALLQADLERPEEVEKLAVQTASLSALVHNASLFERDDEDPNGTRHKQVNFSAPLLLTEKFLDTLTEDRRGNVVFMLDNTPMPPFLHRYAASKSDLRTALPSLALCCAPRLRINAVALGPTLRAERESEEHFQALVEATPLQKQSAAEDVAAAVLFLLQNASVTGEILNVDSGLNLLKT